MRNYIFHRCELKPANWLTRFPIFPPRAYWLSKAVVTIQYRSWGSFVSCSFSENKDLWLLLSLAGLQNLLLVDLYLYLPFKASHQFSKRNPLFGALI